MENHELEAERGRRLLEEIDEIVLVLDEHDRLVAASRRAHEAIDGLAHGELVAAELLQPEPWRPRRIPIELDGRRESLVYLRAPGTSRPTRSFEPASLRPSRTSCGHRWLASSRCSRPQRCPSADVQGLLEQSKAEVEQIRGADRRRPLSQ